MSGQLAKQVTELGLMVRVTVSTEEPSSDEPQGLFLASMYTFKIAINQVTDSAFIKYINIPNLGVVVKVRCQNYFNRLE